jgi:hypothetical protein
MNICGEIEYNGVHSDICLGHDLKVYAPSDEQREFLVGCLKEWLAKSNGTGFFYIGNIDDIIANFGWTTDEDA